MAINSRGQEEIPLNILDRCKRLFERYDTDHDGYLNIRELSELINSREYENDIPNYVVNVILQKADSDMDGRLNYNEFVHLMTNPDYKGFFGHHFAQYVNFMVPRRVDARHSQVDGEYEDQYRCCPPPLAMICISLIILVLFVVDETQKLKTLDGPIASMFLYDPHRRREAWRFVTYMFVHVGWFHLIVNLIVQIMLGIPLEMVHGWWRILIIYFVGVLGGSLATSVADPAVKLAGASGGVYSLMTAHVACIIMNWKEMTYPIIQLFIFLIIAFADIGQAMYNRYVLDMEENIGYAAHLAGAATGLLFGIFILRNLVVTKWEKYIKYTSIVVFSLLIGCAIFWNALFPSYFPKETYD